MGCQGDSDNERGSWTLGFGGKKGEKKGLLKGGDLGAISDSEVVFAESLFQVKSVVTTPVKKLQRSKQHTIDTSLIPSVLDKYDSAFVSPRSPMSVASRKSMEMFKENSEKDTRKSWTAEVERAYHSNGDSRRKSLEPVFGFRPHGGDSSRTVTSESTFSKRDNSGRSWTLESSTDDDELNMDRSISLASYQSQEEEEEAAYEAANEAADYADAEEKFLQANTDFFETLAIENVRRDQYPKLALHRHVYMDYASLALSSRFQVRQPSALMILHFSFSL